MAGTGFHRRLPPIRRAVVALAAAAATLLAGAGIAQTATERDPVQREGYFEVRSASTQLVEGVHQLDARLQLVLSSEALEALNSALPLRIRVEVQVIRQRRFYMDALEHEINQEFELRYDNLTQRYVVRNLKIDNQDSFATLYSALNNLGRIDNLDVVDDVVLSSNRDYRVRVRALLQTEQLAAPLRLITFWRSEWQLQSEWFEWMLER